MYHTHFTGDKDVWDLDFNALMALNYDEIEIESVKKELFELFI